MTSARTARVTVEVSFTVTDRATEGEMVDAVQAAVRAARPELHDRNGHSETHIVATHISLEGSPGGAL
jgi:hypothetical protein